MSDYTQPHEVSNLATDPRSLNKSFAGFPDVLDPAQGVALLITNKYEGRNWPDDFKHSMSLKGAVKDSIHIRQFLEKFGPTMAVNAQAIDDASRKNIEDHIGKAIESYPPLLITYFQGHGLHHPGMVIYVTSDGRETETLEGLTAKEMVKMFSKSTPGTKLLTITDFCYSGNVYGLKFVLNLGQDGSASWHKTDQCQWGEEIASPMLHIAGSLREEQVYETRNAGGYLTESLANLKAEPISLPQILLHLRERVDHHLSIAKEHPKYSGKLKGAKQVPQIYSNYMWPLDDPKILSKIGLRKNVPISY